MQEKRQDREIEGLFTTLQNTVESRDSSIEKFRLASEAHLSEIKSDLESVKNVLETVLADSPTEDPVKEFFSKLTFVHLMPNNAVFNFQYKTLEENRARRQTEWQQFVDDMAHKCARIDNTFEEKEEELRDFYSDLERKLHINI